MVRVKSLPLNFVLVAFGIIATSLFIISSPAFDKNNSFTAFAVTFDLTISITVAYYFLIVRKYKIFTLSVLPVYIVTVMLAYLIIPTVHQNYLAYFKELIVIPELTFLTFLIIKIRVVVKKFKNTNFITKDFIEQLYTGLNKVFRNKILSGVFATEFSVIYYAITFWKRKKEVNDGQKYISTYKNTFYFALWFMLTMGIIVEGFSLHIFIGKYSNAAAWVFTAIGIYSLLFIIADFSAMVRRPIVITKDLLYLRCGLRWRAVIPFEKIELIQPVKNFKDDSKEYVNISSAKQPNAILVLKEPLEVKGLYWLRKTTYKISFCADDFKLIEKSFNTYLKQECE